ncbi:acetate--CoA ligase family protein [Streptomyces sp. ISL-98]|nr:acetate--CoA ligase family protein [Streptomyces sp. ISL-98]
MLGQGDGPDFVGAGQGQVSAEARGAATPAPSADGTEAASGGRSLLGGAPSRQTRAADGGVPPPPEGFGGQAADGPPLGGTPLQPRPTADPGECPDAIGGLTPGGSLPVGAPLQPPSATDRSASPEAPGHPAAGAPLAVADPLPSLPAPRVLAGASGPAVGIARPWALRVAAVGDSGGQGALAADALVARGLDVPGLSAGAASAVAALLPPGAACGNPVDLAGAGEADLGNYARIARALLFGGDADAVVLTGYFGDYATANPAQADRECEVASELAYAARESGRLLVVHTMACDTPALAVLRAHAVPVYERIEQAATALAGAARLHTTVVAAPAASPRQASYSVPDGGYETVRELLASYGLTFPAAEFVATADEAVEAAYRTGYPLALKAMGLAHKTEVGDVALGIAEEGGLRAAFARMRSATGAARYVVEAMASPPYAVELIVGVRRDPAFGPVAVVGIGGVNAELLADTAVALAPLTPERARELLLSLRHAPLLTGWRGAPPVHLDAAAAALCAVARAGAEHPELSELEVNPLLVHPGGAIALDAHGVLR